MLLKSMNKKMHKKRIRRRADEIKRRHFCIICEKKYGSRSALNLHKKMKKHDDIKLKIAILLLCRGFIL